MERCKCSLSDGFSRKGAKERNKERKGIILTTKETKDEEVVGNSFSSLLKGPKL